MEQTPIKEEDWRENISEPSQTLKLGDGDIVIGTFQDEGEKRTHVDYGTSIAFQFLEDGQKEPKTFYVKTNNFDFLRQIKSLGKLTGLKVKISRVGTKRSDTRYKITKI